MISNSNEPRNKNLKQKEDGGSSPFKFNQKWSPEVATFSFTQVPNLLLTCQGHLKITDGELLTLIHLQTFWFSADSQIFPSITTLARFSHKSYATVQKRLRDLESKGFVRRRHYPGYSNRYDMEPCIRKLTEHSRTCPDLAKKLRDRIEKTTRVPSSISRNEEYEARRILREYKLDLDLDLDLDQHFVANDFVI